MNCSRCNNPIDEHEAGSKTNMCVAVVVFGKNEHYYDCPHFSESGRLLSFCSCPDLPYYSTSISAAWEVWRKLPNEFDGEPCSWRMDYLGPDLVYVSIGLPNKDDYTEMPWFIWGDGPAPLAICRAAIKSVHIAIAEEK